MPPPPSPAPYLPASTLLPPIVTTTEILHSRHNADLAGKSAASAAAWTSRVRSISASVYVEKIHSPYSELTSGPSSFVGSLQYTSTCSMTHQSYWLSPKMGQLSYAAPQLDFRSNHCKVKKSETVLHSCYAICMQWQLLAHCTSWWMYL